MQVVWKYPLRRTALQTLAVPAGGEFLTAQLQGGIWTLWAQVDAKQPNVTRHIQVVDTGNDEIVNGARYIGTFQEGMFVWHLYEVTS